MKNRSGFGVGAEIWIEATVCPRLARAPWIRSYPNADFPDLCARVLLSEVLEDLLLFSVEPARQNGHQ